MYLVCWSDNSDYAKTEGLYAPMLINSSYTRICYALEEPRGILTVLIPLHRNLDISCTTSVVPLTGCS